MNYQLGTYKLDVVEVACAQMQFFQSSLVPLEVNFASVQVDL